MVIVDFGVTIAADFKINKPVAGNLVQHMIQEGNTCLKFCLPTAVKVDANSDLCFKRISAHKTLTCGHVGSPYVEDIGIVLGQAVNQALGDKSGIRRYGHAYVPLDEALSRVVIDFSGRPGIIFNAEFKRSHVGQFDVDLVFEFFQGFVNHAQVTLHLDVIRGRNEHHKIETLFKAFGRALRMAIELDPRMAGQMPSTKGSL